MINIITAINNPKLNEELKKENNINIICKDIFYREGILEILENTKEKINYIIIDYNLPGEIELNNLFNFIKINDEKIKIILTIKKENKINIENKKIIKIFYKNNINLSYLKNYNSFENINNYIIKKNSTKIIAFFGDDKVGKSMTILNMAYFLKYKKNKILIIELNDKNIYFLLNNKINKKNKKIIVNYKKTENQILKNKINKTILRNKIKNIDENLDLISKKKIINFNKIKKLENKYNYIFIKFNFNKNLEDNKKNIEKFYNKIIIIRPNLIGIKNAKKIIENHKLKNAKIIINNYNKNSIDEKIIKNIFLNKKIIGKIKYNENYEKLINTKFKKFENKNLEIENIINKL